MRRLCMFHHGFRSRSHYAEVAARTNRFDRSIPVRPACENNRWLNRRVHQISELRLCGSFGVKQAEHVQTGAHMSLLQPAKIDLLRVGSNNSLTFTADRTD